MARSPSTFTGASTMVCGSCRRATTNEAARARLIGDLTEWID